jgi:hypothetical protein
MLRAFEQGRPVVPVARRLAVDMVVAMLADELRAPRDPLPRMQVAALLQRRRSKLRAPARQPVAPDPELELIARLKRDLDRG